MRVFSIIFSFLAQVFPPPEDTVQRAFLSPFLARNLSFEGR